MGNWSNQVERIALGEECDFYFVADVLKLAIQQWNESVDLKKQKLSSAGGLLQTLEAVTAGEEGFQENEAVARVENSVAEQMGRLQKITLKPTENNFLILGWVWLVFLCSFLWLVLGASHMHVLSVYLYIYIYVCCFFPPVTF